MTDIRSTILVVDDDVVDRETSGRYLRKNFDVQYVTTGDEALKSVLKHSFSCILLDLGLPDVNGQELISPLSKSAAVIVMTGQGHEVAAVNAMRDGAADYLVKDQIDRDTLLRSVNGAIERRRLERMISDQQQRLLEDERLKVLIQLAGSSLLDLNEPITRLNVLLQRMGQSGERSERDSAILEDSLRTLAEITAIMQRIHHLRLEDGGDRQVNFDLVGDGPPSRIVLCVDDDRVGLAVVRKLLENHAEALHITEIKTATTVAMAEEVIKSDPIDLIISDFQLEDGSAIDVLRFAAQNENAPPVVVVSGSGNEDVVAEILRAGATDYVSKQSLSNESLKAALIRGFERAALSAQLRKSREKMHDLAFTDELTKIYNRRFLTESMSREFDRIARHQGRVAFCLLDLDRFKVLNDTYGHAAGDHALRETAQVLEASVRKTDLVARYGGEEFAVFLPDADEDAALSVAETIRANLENREIVFEGQRLPVTASIGVALTYSGDNVLNTVPEIIAAADRALYDAKENGRNRVVLDKRV